VDNDINAVEKGAEFSRACEIAKHPPLKTEARGGTTLNTGENIVRAVGS
jgi:hypothetical protein